MGDMTDMACCVDYFTAKALGVGNVICVVYCVDDFTAKALRADLMIHYRHSCLSK